MTCSYRWHVHDPLVFNTGIRVTFETFGWMSPDENKEHRAHSWNEREDDFSSVAFWYQMGPTKKFTEVPPRPSESCRVQRNLVWGKTPSTGSTAASRGSRRANAISNRGASFSSNPRPERLGRVHL